MKNLIFTLLISLFTTIGYSQNWGTVIPNMNSRSVYGSVATDMADTNDMIGVFDEQDNLVGEGHVYEYQSEHVFNLSIYGSSTDNSLLMDGEGWAFKLWDSQTDTYLEDNNNGQFYGSYVSGNGDPIEPFNVTPFAQIFPVEYTYIKAESRDCSSIVLSWETASEKNNKGWFIQRSSDGRNWKNLDFVEGSENSSKLVQYKYIDDRLDSGVKHFYYRLNQEDFDGKKISSDALSVSLNCDNIFNIYPNPASTYIHITKEEGGTVTIYNFMGQIIMQDVQRSEIDVSGLDEGIYMVKYDNNNSINTKRLVIR